MAKEIRKSVVSGIYVIKVKIVIKVLGGNERLATMICGSETWI